MHGYVSNSDNKQQNRINTFSTEAYIDSMAYNIWIPAELLHDNDSSITAISATSQYSYRIFPEGKFSRIYYIIQKPKMWIDGWATARIHWSSGGLDAGNFRVSFGIIGTSGDGTGSPDIQIPAFQTYNVTTTLGAMGHNIDRTPEASHNPLMLARITQDISLINFGFTRDGSSGLDTAVSDYRMIGIELIYLEVKKNAGWKYNPDYNAVYRP